MAWSRILTPKHGSGQTHFLVHPHDGAPCRSLLTTAAPAVLSGEVIQLAATPHHAVLCPVRVYLHLTSLKPCCRPSLERPAAQYTNANPCAQPCSFTSPRCGAAPAGRGRPLAGGLCCKRCSQRRRHRHTVLRSGVVLLSYELLQQGAREAGGGGGGGGVAVAGRLVAELGDIFSQRYRNYYCRRLMQIRTYKPSCSISVRLGSEQKSRHIPTTDHPRESSVSWHCGS